MDDPEILTFEPWPDPIIDTIGQHPEGNLSRLAWLPTVGPTSWLVWGTLAAQLRADAAVSWELVALAQAHGVNRASGRNGVMRRTLARLEQFRLAAPLESDRYLVRLCAPPLRRTQLDRLPAFVAQLHRQSYPAPQRQVG